MSERRTATWKLVLGYAAFGLAAFAFFFYLTFPYGALRDRIVREASNAGYDVKIGSLGPGLFGITASDVKVNKKAPATPAPGSPEKPATPLELDSVALRPSFYPLGLAVRARAFGGKITGAVGGLGDVALRLNLDGVDLSKGNLKGFTGVDLAGVLDGQLALDLPKVAAPGGRGASQPDFGAATGTLKLEGRGVTVNGGTVSVALPMYGPEPTPLDLPKIGIGDVDAKVSFEKGAGKVETLTAKSQDLDVIGSGTMKLARRPEYSEPNLEIRLKANPDFVKRLGMIGAGLSMMRADPRNPQYRLAHLTGYLGRPNFR